MDSFPPPISGASLLLSFKMRKKTMLIIGGDALAASRAYAALEADADVIVLAKGGSSVLCEELKWRADKGQVIVIDWTTLAFSTSTDASSSNFEFDVERYISSLDWYLTKNLAISLVCITDTISPSPSHQRIIAPRIARLCQAHRIPVNVTDMPELCDFSFTATHRFTDAITGAKSALQVGVTTNGEGCRLGGRVRRDIVASLPKEVGGAVYKVGQLRRLAREQAEECGCSGEGDRDEGEDSGVNTPNRPVPIRTASEEESRAEAARRRMKWVAQVSEYWPIPRLASMTEKQMREILNGGTGLPSGEAGTSSTLAATEDRSQHGLELGSSTPKKKGRILLVGSGPGHPSLLTIATHNALTKHADLVLSDKLVPAAVLELIPRHVEVRIARKFPGNADGAQSEMMEAAIEAASRGLTVVRLKQGDPVVYGRAGEEVLYFREHGFEPLVVPGVSSALAAPTFAGIPVTQRGVAEAFIVCTGVGRQGKEVRLPGYERARTVLILMGVARLGEVVGALVRPSGTTVTEVDRYPASMSERQGRRDGLPYPSHLPIAIIERGSMPDQRVIVSTLADIEAALASVGEQRPPGMMVVGWSVLALSGRGDVRVLEEGEAGDEERVRRWLNGRKWNILEGIAEGWSVI